MATKQVNFGVKVGIGVEGEESLTDLGNRLEDVAQTLDKDLSEISEAVSTVSLRATDKAGASGVRTAENSWSHRCGVLHHASVQGRYHGRRARFFGLASAWSATLFAVLGCVIVFNASAAESHWMGLAIVALVALIGVVRPATREAELSWSNFERHLDRDFSQNEDERA